MGLTGYYHKFIRDYSKVAQPITKYLKKGVKINTRDPTYIDAFLKLKNLISTHPILRFPNFDKPFTLTTDASNYALGAVLSQEGHPVCYASRTLNDHERNYSATDKEFLAIIWSVGYFRPYLYGRKFKIRTDHQPIKYLQAKYKGKDLSPRHQRWLLKLGEYDCEIEYLKGKENKVADFLSRLENSENMENTKEGTFLKNVEDNTSDLNVIGNIEDESDCNATIHSAEENLADNEFKAARIKEFLSQEGIQLHITKPNSHTGNADIERLHNTLAEKFRIWWITPLIMMWTPYNEAHFNVTEIKDQTGFVDLQTGNQEIVKDTDIVIHMINIDQIEEIINEMTDNIILMKIKNKDILQKELLDTRNKLLTLLPRNNRYKRGLMNAIGSMSSSSSKLKSSCLDEAEVRKQKGADEYYSRLRKQVEPPAKASTGESATAEERVMWKTRDNKALATITLSVRITELINLKTCKTAKEAWSKLLSIFLLCSLPSELESFVIAIESRDVLPSVEQLKNKILEEEQRRCENSRGNSDQCPIKMKSSHNQESAMTILNSCVNEGTVNEWLLDSGASSHVCREKCLFSDQSVGDAENENLINNEILTDGDSCLSTQSDFEGFDDVLDETMKRNVNGKRARSRPSILRTDYNQIKNSGSKTNNNDNKQLNKTTDCEIANDAISQQASNSNENNS
ncbi:Retrovirus-related Pol polyprotein from transposon 17.6 [Eumeta japonica]|uniref:Retrovirus-related Pol polyprotein from transposon 17.6 n=1 Tax=Eumeta variegata TaxID=151549 RepID=A0A4C1SZX1_EUMVA|nr:Retrovirus-related Pol polyprotein from transposon 17.6 [Eumeta japonica]